MRPRSILVVCLAMAGAVAAPSLPGQKDLRDVVTTTAGKEIRGRVLERYDPDHVVIAQGGRRERVPVAQVASMRTVLDHMRTFFELRRQAAGNAAREWMLAEWAVGNDLPALAKLQAMHVVLLDDSHAAAHELLGHRQSPRGWLWPRGDSWMTREQYEAKTSEFGSPKILDGEHFRLRSNAALRPSIDALVDLEALYVFWFDSFGEALQPREVLDPMDVHLHRDPEDFPAFTSLRIPYYFPQPNGDIAYTYLAPAAARPELLFQLGTEQLLYNALADGMSAVASSPKQRLAAWVDVGLGQWIESCLRDSEPGYATPSPPKLDRGQAALVLQDRRYGLPNMIGLRYGMFHNPATATQYHWAISSTFVAFLMAEDAGGLRSKFLEFVRQAYAGGKGSSSSVLDRVLGVRVEKLEQPWLDWVARTAGVPATHR